MQKKEFIQHIREDLANDVKHNKTSVERIAASFGITDKNTVKEFTELAIVLEARRLSLRALPVYDRYMSIVELYNKQVTLSHRTSQSMLLQQYSTPAPIGFIAGIFCGMDKKPSGRTGFKSYFEPSAGNGLLTIAAYPETFIVNEIDDTRNENLKEQGFSEVKKQDATKPFAGFSKIFDAIITNPPFGKVEPVKVNEFEFTVLDHVMCIWALDTMKDGGSAALIIGGHTAWDDKGRIQAGKNRNFFVYLHKYYNVIDCINIDGHKLYSRQGTAFNVRLILISGRKKVPGGFPPFYNANQDYTVFSFEELYNRVTKYIDRDLTDKNNITSAMENELELEAEALALELELMSFNGIGKLDEEILDELANMYENAMTGKVIKLPIKLGALESSEIKKIKEQTGKDFSGFKRFVRWYEARHIYKIHGGEHEKLLNQIPIGVREFMIAPVVVKSFDKVEFQPKEKSKDKEFDTLKYSKRIGKEHFVVEEIIYDEKILRLKTMYIKNKASK